MKKVGLIILLLLVLTGGVYLYFSWKAESFRKQHSTDTILIIDNPSGDDLLITMNTDTIDVKAWSTLQYPVRKRAKSENTHVVSRSRISGKILADTIWSPGDSIGDHFINAACQRYVVWDVDYISPYERIFDTVRYTDNFVYELPVFHRYDTLTRIGNLLVGEQVHFINSFIIPTSDYQTLFNSDVKHSIESYSFSGTITKHYLLSEQDFISNFMRMRNVRSSQATKNLLVYMMGSTCERLRKTDPSFHVDPHRFQRPPLGYFYSKSDLDDLFEEYGKVPTLKSDTSFTRIGQLMAVIDSTEYHDEIPNPYFSRHPQHYVTFSENWSGFFDPQLKLQPFETEH